MEILRIIEYYAAADRCDSDDDGWGTDLVVGDQWSVLLTGLVLGHDEDASQAAHFVKVEEPARLLTATGNLHVTAGWAWHALAGCDWGWLGATCAQKNIRYKFVYEIECNRVWLQDYATKLKSDYNDAYATTWKSDYDYATIWKPITIMRLLENLITIYNAPV